MAEVKPSPRGPPPGAPRDYDRGEAIDWHDGEGIGRRAPGGSEGDAGRILRGGSWDDPTHYVRAASRDRDHPRVRDDRLGFRLSRSQGREAERE